MRFTDNDVGSESYRLDSTIKRRAVCASTTVLMLAATVAGAPAAFAQSKPADDAAPADGRTLEEIQVTGTRIVRDGYQAPTPTTVVGEEEIKAASPANIADFVNTLPALAGSATPANGQSSVSAGGAGLNVLNLRNLGAARTLVLLDGQRVVGSQPTGLVDINNFPQQLIQRVDIVTGGASAAYGSDAFSGVVNFILDKQFTGFKAEASRGVTTYGDDKNTKIALTAGSGFASDRGHVLLSVEGFRNEGVLFNDRPWNKEGWKVMNNPDYTPGNGQPERLVLPHVAQNVITPGGIITAGPLKGIAFGPGGQPYKFDYGPLSLDPWMQGGEWQNNDISDFTTLQPRQDRKNAFGRISYDITDNVNVYAQVSWSSSRVDASQTSPKYNQGNLTIPSSNAFIPDDIRALMVANNVTSLRMGSMNLDLPPSATDNDRTVNRYVVGANGSFAAFGSDWQWDGYYQLGRTDVTKQFVDRITANFSNALDSVADPVTGLPVCRSTLTNPGNGCVPYNVFGIGVNSDRAVDYIIGTSYNRQWYTQEVAAANLSGEPFSDWAGPVSVAVGVEHRKEDGGGYSDPISTANGYTLGNQLATLGSYNVTEGYIETVVPLAKDLPWVRALDFNGAVRFTDYSTSGFVTTWKGGLVYQATDSLRLRATRSRDIRAPNRQELFATGVFTTNTLIDPFQNNQAVTYTTNTSGNLDLQPEKGDTLGLGLVYQPLWLSGFSASVDYYDIKISDAIGSLGPQDIVDQCFAGNQTFCEAVTRDPVALTISEIKSSPFNFVNQRARGLDLEASYRFSASDIVNSWSGDLMVRGLATHFLENYTSNGVNVPTDTVGQNTGFGPPDWRYTLQLAYSSDPVTFTVTGRGISAGVYDNSFIECASGCPTSTVNNRTINDNHIDGALFVDTNLVYRFAQATGGGADMEVFFNVTNVFNEDPAIVAPGPGGVSFVGADYNSTFYDGLGRVFRLGVRIQL